MRTARLHMPSSLAIRALLVTLIAAAVALPAPLRAQRRTSALTVSASRLRTLKHDAIASVDANARLTQRMIDELFSFGELGFQETHTSRYLTNLLRQNGFTVQDSVAGIPTSWVATWGSGKPVIALGSDLDGIPQASQMPGVACHMPIVPGAPGHGEGHNTGQPVNITAALAVKAIMEREHLPGTIKIWPGVAEEQLGSKAYLVRAGVFKDVDVALFSHVGSNLETHWGGGEGSGLVSVLYSFGGSAAHAAGAPWRGRSALDAVELMDAGWNFRREHLRPQQRSHYVIPDGGDQPNVVPTTASVWYYFRELTYPRIKEMWAIGDSIAQGAAMMTGTKLVSERVLGSAWPRHFNKPIAEATLKNIEMVGLPTWSEADQTLARAVQKLEGTRQTGLATHVDTSVTPRPDRENMGGGSDDIGDVSWNVPTITLRYPSNIPGLPGHHWSSAIASATPIAHKGATAGAKVMALTMLDILTHPALVDSAWSYFRNVQTKEIKYQPLMRPNETPATFLNADIMARYRPEMEKFYYDTTKYDSYLEQLGVTYPTVPQADGKCVVDGRVASAGEE